MELISDHCFLCLTMEKCKSEITGHLDIFVGDYQNELEAKSKSGKKY